MRKRGSEDVGGLERVCGGVWWYVVLGGQGRKLLCKNVVKWRWGKGGKAKGKGPGQRIESSLASLQPPGRTWPSWPSWPACLGSDARAPAPKTECEQRIGSTSRPLHSQLTLRHRRHTTPGGHVGHVGQAVGDAAAPRLHYAISLGVVRIHSSPVIPSH